jgi:hypothetical protein
MGETVANESSRPPTPESADVELTDDEVVALVASWIEKRQPGAVVRFGEGEGRLLVADFEDEESLRVAANKVRRQAGLLIDAEQVLQLREEITRALDKVDVAGIRGSDWFSDEHTMWVQRIEEVFERRLDDRKRSASYTGHCLVNNQLRDALPDLLASRSQISVITSRDLEETLQNDYEVDARIFPIPSQYIMRNVDGEYEAKLHEVPIWPDYFGRLREELTVRQPGEVFLIGAGLFGKELCIKIKEEGGIALDMGSALDGLAGKVTRGRNKPDAFPLPARPRAGEPAASTPPSVASEAASETPGRAVARKFYPYLESTGWVDSNATNSSVDGDGKPIPWYRYAAIDFFAERADETMEVFEFGSGNSTLWWAERTAHVTAVEHNADWATKIAEAAPENAEILKVELEPDGDYCRTPARLGSEFDVLIIDGRDRVNCSLQCLTALRPGGVIIWDDSHRRRYRHGLGVLRKHGFRRIRFTGLGPISPEPGETSILYRPDNCFQI